MTAGIRKINFLLDIITRVYSTNRVQNCSAMQRATGLQFYYGIDDPNVSEYHISTKYSKCNRLPVTNDLLNSENLKVVIVELCHELQVCIFTMVQLTQT